jgi:hypothetical protein
MLYPSESPSPTARLGDRNPAPADQQGPRPPRRSVRTSGLFAHSVSWVFFSFSSRPMVPTQTHALPRIFPSPHPRSRCFVISHAHLDHVNGLVLSAGSLQGPRKRVCAPQYTLKTLETIFADRIWPSLASWDADDAAYKLLYDPCVRLSGSHTHVAPLSRSYRTKPNRRSSPKTRSIAAKMKNEKKNKIK